MVSYLKIKKTGQTGRSGSAEEWIYGLNPVLEAIRAGRNIKTLFISFSRRGSVRVLEIEKEAEQRNISIVTADTRFFDATFPKGHQGVAAKVSPKCYIDLDELLKVPSKRDEPPLFIILDCTEDPRNFGAILRVADATGVHGIVIQSRRSVTVSSEVSKASAGAVEYVPVSMVPNIKHVIYEMKEMGITVVGAEAGAEKIAWDLDLKAPLTLVIGSEGKGLRKTVRESCDILVSLPMQGKINSLNVSVTTGILAFEILRQRGRKN